MRSDALTVADYLASLPDDRRTAIAAVREVLLENLPTGLEETMNWGMIAYEVPLSTYPETYNGQPLMHTALASQKNHMALYLGCLRGDDSDRRAAFEEAYRASGHKPNMGRGCVRFRTLDALPLDVIAKWVGQPDVPTLCAIHDDDMAERKKK